MNQTIEDEDRDTKPSDPRAIEREEDQEDLALAERTSWRWGDTAPAFMYLACSLTRRDFCQ